MKPLLFNIPKTEQGSFKLQVDQQPYFYDTLHFHPELQLTLFISGTGTQFVGDGIRRFNPGDLVLLGSNLPHVSRSDTEYYQKESPLVSHSVSIFFNKEMLGQVFLELPETKPLLGLFNASARGLKFMDYDAIRLHKNILDLWQLSDLDRLLQFLNILGRLVKCKHEFISGISFHTPQKENDNLRINAVFELMMSNFYREIRLEEAAEAANMSITAFCRYFKLRTRKTFFEFLNEVRIGHACKLLKEGERSVSEISLMCGFNNQSNFNRQFKAQMHLGPKAYSKMQV